MLNSASIAIALFSVSAMAATIRDSGISCAAVPSTRSQLILYDETDPDDVVREVLGLDPVQDANSHPVLQRVEVYEYEFQFFQCSGTYLGYDSEQTFPDNVSRWFGQVRLIGNDNSTSSCLTVRPDGGSLITLEDCSVVDDISQTYQFWKVTQNQTTLDPAPLTFVGNTTYDQTTVGYYSTSVAALGSNQVVTADYHNALNAKTDFQIMLNQTSL